MSSVQEAPRIAIIDDDPDAAGLLARFLAAYCPGYVFSPFRDRVDFLNHIRSSLPEVCVIDLSLDPNLGVESGYSLLSEIRDNDPSCRIIVLTGHGQTKHGVRALNSGAANFLQKPSDPAHLGALIRDGIEQARLRRVVIDNRYEGIPLSEILVGTSAQIERVRREVSYAASMNQAVLLTGETGTGKGVCARAIHMMSTRRNQPFIRYQTSGNGIDLVASDLFGHVKGAFTGASEKRRGLLIEAHKGSFFLDEVDELPLGVQVMMLHAIQEGTFRAVGNSREEASDFRLIAAMNQDPDAQMVSGKLRKDLYHRIAHCRIHVPSLKERLEDIRPLVAHILQRLSERERFMIFSLDERSWNKLESYEWPGNIRELEAVIEGAAYRANFNNRSRIIADDILIHSSENLSKNFNELVEAYKKRLILLALAKNNGNQFKTAQELEIDRGTIRRIVTAAQDSAANE